MNLKTLLNKSSLELKKAGIETPELDARVILENAIGKDSAFIYSHPEFTLSRLQYFKFQKNINRRKTGEPVAYILGHKEFYGYDFFVNKNVLVPRPESEWLVEEGATFIKKYQLPTTNCQLNVLDMGTGSGCLIISLAKELEKQYSNTAIQQYNFYGVEISKRAIGVAKKNSEKHKTGKKINFFISDLFQSREIKNKIFDLILANLPYVPKIRIQNTDNRIQINRPQSISFEPQDAIFASDNGTAIIKRFLTEAKDHLSRKGMILSELDPRNAKELLESARAHFPTSDVTLKKDLAGLDRYITINK